MRPVALKYPHLFFRFSVTSQKSYLKDFFRSKVLTLSTYPIVLTTNDCVMQASRARTRCYLPSFGQVGLAMDYMGSLYL